MLLLAISAFIILMGCLWIHYHQHFQFSFTNNRFDENGPFSPSNATSRPRSFAVATSPRMNLHQNCCGLWPKENEEFDFFPASFLFYIMFLMLLCILTVVVQILYIVIDDEVNLSNLLFASPVQSHHMHSLNELHRIRVRTAEDIYITVIVLDYILIYGIMLLALWESLFSFYRYYTTMRTLKSLEVPSALTVLPIF